MAANQTIYTSLEAQTEELDGEWRATQDALGLTAYGKTAEEAGSRLMTAANLLIDELLRHGGTKAVTRCLERAGILFTVGEKQENVRRTLPLVISLAKPLDSD